MIEFVPRGTHNYPAFVCDTCRELIVGPGNVVWAVKVPHIKSDVRETSPVYAAHRGRCDRVLEKWLMTQYDDEWMPLWEEIGEFAAGLAHYAKQELPKNGESQPRRQLVKHPASDPHQELPDFS
ncbi:hypothetical protein [Streptomyces flavochromogenes]|uniref:hypothetical protein n=1 Tax=Streptomyces flavochromogenes TaxID=68199 RepID=UPI0004BFF97F|nr:hypothetical protein [Streptomyces flavochromogenes]